MAYCSLAEVRQELGNVSGLDDSLIADNITYAQDAIDAFCHRTFEGSDSTKYIDAIGDHVCGYSLFVNEIGDGELASITTVTNGDGVVVSSSEYVTIPRNDGPYYGLRILGSAGKTWTFSTDWESAISIVGVWAYSTTAPDAIKRACIRLAAFYYRQKDAQVYDVTATPELGQITIPQGIPADVQLMIRKFVKP